MAVDIQMVNISCSKKKKHRMSILLLANEAENNHLKKSHTVQHGIMLSKYSKLQ